MILTLDVSGPQAGKLGAGNHKVFHAAGGTIGRLPDNHWVLPDPHVSGRHAVVRYVSGVFYVEDTSTNGVFINSLENRLARGQPYALKSGDRIFIEPFEIQASITSGSTGATLSPATNPFETESIGAASAASDPFAPDHPVGRNVALTPRPPLQPLPPEMESQLVPGDEVDPLNLLGFSGQRASAPNVPRAADLARGSLLNEPYQAPDLVSAARPPAPAAYETLIPEDYDPLITDSRPITPPVTPVVRKNANERLPERPVAVDAPRRNDGDVGLAAVLAGAGLADVPVTPELARSFGQILRVVVSGVMDVLQARQQTKEEFRMGMTRFKPADNNPLKFSANVDDALHNLLIKRNAAYLGPVEAFEDAFADLRNHQMATLAGVRVAFEAMLAEFDPDRLQETFDREGKTASLLPMPGRLRYWTRYRERFGEMLRDADTSFRELFGDEFAKAYEEQLKRLKAQSRERQR